MTEILTIIQVLGSAQRYIVSGKGTPWLRHGRTPATISTTTYVGVQVDTPQSLLLFKHKLLFGKFATSLLQFVSKLLLQLQSLLYLSVALRAALE